MKKVFLIGQAPPKTDPSRPFGRTKLYKWLESIGIGFDYIDQYFAFSALIDYFPGLKGSSHRVPDHDEIMKSRPRLIKEIKDFDPEIILTIGKLSTAYALDQEEVNLKDVIGRRFDRNLYGAFDKEFIIIPLPHPSGASTWHYKKENQLLLEKALRLIKKVLTNSK